MPTPPISSLIYKVGEQHLAKVADVRSAWHRHVVPSQRRAPHRNDLGRRCNGDEEARQYPRCSKSRSLYRSKLIVINCLYTSISITIYYYFSIKSVRDYLEYRYIDFIVITKIVITSFNYTCYVISFKVRFAPFANYTFVGMPGICR